MSEKLDLVELGVASEETKNPSHVVIPDGFGLDYGV